jgi:UDP-2,4-diacetamido-2,4,6-trideoxy-beta-L-altropyranose hydrolase
VVMSHVGKLMVIDDLANRKHKCDILLDQNYLEDYGGRYEGLAPNHCLQLLGPKYVLLRKEFNDALEIPIKRDGSIRNILVFYGGTDPTNETLKTLKALSKLNFKIKTIEVIVGSSNKFKEQIRSFCNTHSNMYYHEQVKNMALFMSKADLAIGAGGTTTWERCFLGLPSLTVLIAENQIQITEAVANFGATINLGWFENLSEVDLIQAVNILKENPQMLVKIGSRARQLIETEIVTNDPVACAIMEGTHEYKGKSRTN